jgi:hypothetical protein
MDRLSNFLAGLAFVSAAVAIAMAYYVTRMGGAPALFFLSSVALMLATMSAGLALVLAAILFARKGPARPIRAAWLSLAALILAGGYLALI